MPINFTTLTAAKTVPGSIANWVNRSDLPTEILLLEAEALIYQRLRVREMQSGPSALTIAAGASSVALPADYLDPIDYTPYEWGEPLPHCAIEHFRAPRDAAGALHEGTPSKWTAIGTSLHVDVRCAPAFSGVLMYYAQPAPLSGSNETNFLTVRYPSLLRYACMAKAYEHMKDERAAGYVAAMEGALGEAARTNDLYRRAQYMPA